MLKEEAEAMARRHLRRFEKETMTEDEVRDRLRAEVLSFYKGHYGETPTDEHLTRICELIEEERRDHE